MASSPHSHSHDQDHDHDHEHDHGHDHGHAHAHGVGGHHHAPASFGRAFAIGTALNLGYIVLEAGYGLHTGSMALLADAGHNLSDVLGLLLAWGGATLAQRAATPRRTYGFRSSTILAALGNAIALLLAIGAIGWEAVGRFSRPEPVAGGVIAWVAAAGIVVNAFTAWLFAGGRHHDLNVRGAYLHMLADAAVSAGVVVAGIIISFTGWQWLDPTISLIVVALIAIGTWGLLRESVDLALHAVPAHVDPDAVRAYLLALPGVTEVHDLHIWGMSTTDTALTAHITRPGPGHDTDTLLADVAHVLRDRFGIRHPTIQIERGDGPHRCHNCPEVFAVARERVRGEPTTGV